MSAGGISYSGIVGYGKATLPSIDNWYNNANILQDPPKMVMTRKIDKVSETSAITTMIDESGDRACESIKVYARGVNPFTSVSYQNYGTDGGQRVNGFSSSRRGGNLQGRQARLPYSLGPQGQFRPPAVPLQNLYPLSRLPRVATSSFTQPGFTDFSKKAMCGADNSDKRALRKETSMLRSCVRPTATFQIEAPIVENFEVKYVIKNPTKVSAHSGTRTIDLTEQYVGEPVKAVNTQPLHVNAQSNESYVKYVDNNHFNTERYLQDTLHSDVQSKMSQNIQLIPIEDLANVDVRLKDAMNIAADAPIKGYEKVDFIHSDPDLRRPLPAYSTQTNRSRPDNYVNPMMDSYQMPREINRPVTQGYTNISQIQRTDNISSRNFNLRPTINAGEFQGRATVPAQGREEFSMNRETNRQRTSRLVMDMQQGRYS